MPRALVVCCEGKTEEQYFNILLDYHRPPMNVEDGQEGQHIALIDNAWYEHEAAEQAWCVRTLSRNISTQRYHRLLANHTDLCAVPT